MQIELEEPYTQEATTQAISDDCDIDTLLRAIVGQAARDARQADTTGQEARPAHSRPPRVEKLYQLLTRRSVAGSRIAPILTAKLAHLARSTPIASGLRDYHF